MTLPNDATVLQELTLLNLQRSTGAQTDAEIATRINTLTTDLYNRKNAAFYKARNELGRYMDMDHNAAFYKSRSGDVSRLTDDIKDNNDAIKNAIIMDKDITRRQFEINEWYNFNKLETLFFLQLFFIAALLCAIIIFMQKNNTVTNSMAALLMGLLVFGVAAVGIYRYYYTQRTRDHRLWHRRYFGTAAAPEPAAKCVDGVVTLDVNDVIPESVTQCVGNIATRFDDWQEKLQNEMNAYQTYGTSTNTQYGSICAAATEST
jgi:hypothetical protein